jgi:EAL domain-containing protein (putative c-di-GMP-specific phosphodiesterase class I)
VAFASGMAVGSVYGHALARWATTGATAWSVTALITGVVTLGLFTAGAALVVQPFIHINRFRRLTLLLFGSYLIVALTYSWTHLTSSETALRVLRVVIVFAAVVIVFGALVASRLMTSHGRGADRFVVWAAVCFVVGQAVVVLRGVSLIGSTEQSVSTLAAFACLLIAAAHSKADFVARPLLRWSDREASGALAWSVAGVLVAEGLVIAVVEWTSTVWVNLVLVLLTAIQAVLLAWVLLRWIERGRAAEWKSRRYMNRRLPDAIATGEIMPFYQPIIRTSDGSLAGFETLARWNHPTLGVVAASDFIPMADERGYLAAIDWTMIVQAARDLPGNLATINDIDGFVTVNVSPKRVEAVGFAHDLAALLDREGLSPDGLVIEMTETSVITDWATLTANIEALGELGVGFAIDDFGNGNANFNLVCSVEPDLIKLDGALVEMAMASDRGSAILRGVVQTAHAAGAMVVAEGVSDPSWPNTLARLGVDFVQGYAVGIPGRLTEHAERTLVG